MPQKANSCSVLIFYHRWLISCLMIWFMIIIFIIVMQYYSFGYTLSICQKRQKTTFSKFAIFISIVFTIIKIRTVCILKKELLLFSCEGLFSFFRMTGDYLVNGINLALLPVYFINNFLGCMSMVMKNPF